jgi:hypothetical protein
MFKTAMRKIFHTEFAHSGQRPPGVGYAAGQLPLAKSERLGWRAVLEAF